MEKVVHCHYRPEIPRGIPVEAQAYRDRAMA